MLHAVPMFFYNFLFHSRRPDHVQYIEEEGEEHHEEKQSEDGVKPLDCAPKVEKNNSRNATDDAEEQPLSSSWDNKRDSTDELKVAADDSEEDVLSTGSGRIRFFQNQIQHYLTMALEESENYDHRENLEQNLPPMPKIPFVSIDVRTLEETEHSEEDEDDDDDEFLKDFHQILRLTRVESSESACKVKTNDKDEVSLSMEELVPGDEDMGVGSGDDNSATSIATDNVYIFKENKPQSFLLDYLSSNNNLKTAKNIEQSGMHTSPLRQPLKQLVESVHLKQRQGEPSRFRSPPPSPKAERWNQPQQHESSNDMNAALTAASTPYHLHIMALSPERQRHHRHAALNHRCPFPSHISVPMLAPSPIVSDSDSDDNNENLEQEILDPTEPLVCGKIDHSPYLRGASDQMYRFLLDFAETSKDRAGSDIDMLEWMGMHPTVCQVKYQLPSFLDNTFFLPIHYFSAKGWLEGCQAAYQAFPEAIGMETPHVGLPLHYACVHHNKSSNDHHRVVRFLVQKFADSARFTNQESHQTPLHIACQSPKCSLETVQLLLEQYPTASQLADRDGFTPLHSALQHRLPLVILKALQASSPAAIGASTKTWQKPLHIAAESGCDLDVLEWLLQNDRRAAAHTTEAFASPLHCACLGMAKHGTSLSDASAKLELLWKAHPDAIQWTNAEDQTPYDLGMELGLEEPLLDVIKPKPM